MWVMTFEIVIKDGVELARYHRAFVVVDEGQPKKVHCVLVRENDRVEAIAIVEGGLRVYKRSGGSVQV